MAALPTGRCFGAAVAGYARTAWMTTTHRGSPEKPMDEQLVRRRTWRSESGSLRAADGSVLTNDGTADERATCELLLGIVLGAVDAGLLLVGWTDFFVFVRAGS
jgi:hypothetical protein